MREDTTDPRMRMFLGDDAIEGFEPEFLDSPEKMPACIGLPFPAQERMNLTPVVALAVQEGPGVGHVRNKQRGESTPDVQQCVPRESVRQRLAPAVEVFLLEAELEDHPPTGEKPAQLRFSRPGVGTFAQDYSRGRLAGGSAAAHDGGILGSERLLGRCTVVFGQRGYLQSLRSLRKHGHSAGVCSIAAYRGARKYSSWNATG